MIPDDVQAAEELDVLLSARQAGREPPPLPNLPVEEVVFAKALLRLAEELQPDAAFAAQLEERLRMASGRRARLSPHIGGWSVRDRLQSVWLAFSRSNRDRLRVALAMLTMILAVLLAVAPVRAAILSVLQIGAVRIFTSEPTASGLPTLPESSAGQNILAPTAPRAAATPPGTILDLAGETTLADAQERAGFPIRLPSYPGDLGPPDRVYVQDIGGIAVILVWIDHTRPEQVRLSLHQLGPGIDVVKNQPPIIEQTAVNGQPAVWTSGPYPLEVQPSTPTDHHLAARRLVSGHTLVWAVGPITYRLETDQPLDVAVRIAESLH